MTPAAAYLQGDDSHWIACELLHADYQKRRHEAYTAFARECYTTRGRIVTEAHLRFMVGAYQTYLDLAQMAGVDLLNELRRRLPFSYFGHAGKKWRSLDLHYTQILEILTRAANGELESVTAMQNALEVEGLLDGTGNGETIGRQWVRGFLPDMIRFAETPPQDVPPDVVTAFRTAVSLARDWLSE